MGAKARRPKRLPTGIQILMALAVGEEPSTAQWTPFHGQPAYGLAVAARFRLDNLVGVPTTSLFRLCVSVELLQ